MVNTLILFLLMELFLGNFSLEKKKLATNQKQNPYWGGISYENS